MKLGTKGISWLLILTMLLSLLPTAALAAEPIMQEGEPTIETEKTDSITEAVNESVPEGAVPIEVDTHNALIKTIEENKTQTEPLFIRLKGDIYFPWNEDKPLIIPTGMTVVLDLNGYWLDASGYPRTGEKVNWNTDDNYRSPIRVSGTLTIQDTRGTGRYRGSAARKGAVRVETGGIFNLDGGTITNDPEYVKFNHVRQGGGVYVAPGGTFNMNGGTITCTSKSYSNYGGGVYNDGTFNMNGGEIKECKLPYNYAQGGGVYNNGNFTMTDGKIENCEVGQGRPGQEGGAGVFNAPKGTFVMEGGTISGCVNDDFTEHGGHYPADNDFLGGGGVQNLGTFVMNGGTITGNCSPRTKYNGVANNGTFTMNGGTISDNNNVNDRYSGGNGVINGVGVGKVKDAPETAEFKMTDGTISGHKNSGIKNAKEAGAVSAFVITGGTISGNGKGVDSAAVPVVASSVTINGNDSGIDCAGAQLQACTITQNGTGITSQNGPLTITDCTIIQNGNGIISKNGPFTITDCTIENNSRTGILDIGDSLTVTNTSVCGNGQGIHVQGGGTLKRIGGALYNNSNQDVIIDAGCTLESLGEVGSDWILKKCNHPITGWFHDEWNARWSAAKDGKMCAGYAAHCVPFVSAESEGIVDSATGTLTETIGLKAAHEHEAFYSNNIKMYQEYTTVWPGNERELKCIIDNDGSDTQTNCRVEIYFPEAKDAEITGNDQDTGEIKTFKSEFGLYPSKVSVGGVESNKYSVKYYVGTKEYDSIPDEEEGKVTRISLLFPEMKANDRYQVFMQVKYKDDCTFEGKNLTSYIGASITSDQVSQHFAVPAYFETTEATYHSVQYVILNDRISVEDDWHSDGEPCDTPVIVEHDNSFYGDIKLDNRYLNNTNYRDVVQSYTMGGKPIGPDNLLLGKQSNRTQYGGFRILSVTDDVMITLDLPAYYVEHYKQQPNGEYRCVEDDTQKIYGETGRKIEVEPKTYDNYHVNAEKSQLSGVLEVPTVDENGKIQYMTLKVYYDIDLDNALDVVYSDTEMFPEDPAFADQTYKVLPGMPTPKFEGTPTRPDYVFKGWTPQVEETVTKSVTYQATWEKVLRPVSYTIEYYYDGVKKAEKTKTDEVGEIITSEDLDIQQNCGVSYALERIENVPLTLTSDGENNLIKVYYAKDVIGPDGGSDGIPDKYQVLVMYKVIGGVFADQSTEKNVVFTLWENIDGTWNEIENVILGDTIPTDMSPSSGYQYSGQWDKPIDKNTKVVDNIVYTYQFEKVPDIHPIPPKPDFHVPSVLNGADHFAYVNGYEDGTVRPNANITRAEVATIFFRLLTDEARDRYWCQTNGYTDVPADLWSNNAISTLSNMGIINGFEDGTFRPEDTVTRAQFAKIAVSFFQTTSQRYTGRFKDVATDAWYTAYVETAADIGLITGFEDGTFRPDAPITRAQACAIVNRTLGRRPHKDHLLPVTQMITWPDNTPDDWFYADMQEATNSHDYRMTAQWENWTEKLPQRDWASLERQWSDAHSSVGGEVTR